MRVRLSVLLVLLVAVLAVACGSDNESSSTTASPAPAATSAAGIASPTTAAAAATPTREPLRGDLTVFAAASLTDAFNEIGAEFRKANPGVTPKFNFASSSALRTQLEQGAKADTFASADQIQMDQAKQGGVIEGSDQIFAKNKLVVIFPANNPAGITSVQDLAKPGVKFVLTDKAVPIGAYARTALEKLAADPQYGADFDDKVLANLRSEEANVRAVVTKVQLGEADAGIVYASDVTPSVSNDVKSILIPDAFNVIAAYPIAVVKGASNANGARAFIEFVRGPKGQEILKKNGFIVDAETGAAWNLQPSVNGLLTSVQTQERRFSPSFVLDGAVTNPRTYTLADLQALPAVEVAVEFLTGTALQQRTYRGVLLYDLLQAAGPQFDPSRRNDQLRWYVTARATDAYEAVVAWGEFDPGFEAKQVLVAYEEDGQPLGDADGMARLVVPGDQRGGRYVSNLVAITLRPAAGQPLSEPAPEHHG